MSNEFVVKNGLISQGNITGTGSLVISQNITSSNISASGTVSASTFAGALTGSSYGTSSWAYSASNAISASYAPGGSGLSGGTTNYIPLWTGANTLSSSKIYQTASSVLIGQTTFNSTAAEALAVSGSTFNIISGYGNLNSYLQLNIKNSNNGTAGSSDIVATNDTGTETGNYVDLGINSSTHTPIGDVGQANDGYLYNTGSDFYVGNATPSKNLYLFAGGVTNTSSVVVTSTNNVGFGTTIPVNKLDVVGNISASTITASLFFGTSSWSNNASSSLTASYLTIANTYTASNLNITSLSSIRYLAINTSSVYGGTVPFHATDNQLNSQFIFQNRSLPSIGSATILTLSNGTIPFGNGTGLITSSRDYRIINFYPNVATASSDLYIDYWNGTGVTKFLYISGSGNVAVGNGVDGGTPTVAFVIGAPGAVAGTANGLQFSNDTSANLYRSAGASVKTDGNFVVGGTTVLSSSLLVSQSVTASIFSGSAFSGSHFGTSSWAQSASYAISGSVITTTANKNYYFDMSDNTVFSPSYVETTLVYNPSTRQLSGSNLGVSASLYGTSSWAYSASNALSASYAPGGSGLTGGTANYIPLWTGANSQASSVISQSGNLISLSGSLYVTQSITSSNISASNSLSASNMWLANSFTYTEAMATGSLTAPDLYFSSSATTGSDVMFKIEAGALTGSAVGLHIIATGSQPSYAISASQGSILGTTFSGSTFSGSAFSGSYFGTSSWATNASSSLTASYLTTANSYNVTNMVASTTLSASSANNLGVYMASEFTAGSPQIFFVYGVGGGGDFTSISGGVAHQSFGFNSGGAFGGINGNISGRTLYFFDRTSSVYYGAMAGNDKGFYWGTSGTVGSGYSVKLLPPGASTVPVTIAGTTAQSTNLLTILDVNSALIMGVSASGVVTASTFRGTTFSGSAFSGSTFTVTNLTASNITSSGRIVAASFTGSFTGSGTSPHFVGTASWATSASAAISASYAPGGTLSGGTTNYIPLWTAANTQASSVISQSGNIIRISGSLYVSQSITSSGNISASGNISSSTGWYNTLYVSSSLTASGNISASGTGSFSLLGVGTSAPYANSNMVVNSAGPVTLLGISSTATTASATTNAQLSFDIGTTPYTNGSFDWRHVVSPFASASATASKYYIDSWKNGTQGTVKFYLDDAGVASIPNNNLIVGGNSYTPQNTLDVKGNMAIGGTYGGTNTAPANGLIVQGVVGIGATNPATIGTLAGLTKLDIVGASTDVAARIFSNNATALAALSIGRTTDEATFGVGGNGAFVADSVAGDFVLKQNNAAQVIRLGAGSGTSSLVITSTSVLHPTSSVGIGSNSPITKFDAVATNTTAVAKFVGLVGVGGAPTTTNPGQINIIGTGLNSTTNAFRFDTVAFDTSSTSAGHSFKAWLKIGISDGTNTFFTDSVPYYIPVYV